MDEDGVPRAQRGPGDLADGGIGLPRADAVLRGLGEQGLRLSNVRDPERGGNLVTLLSRRGNGNPSLTPEEAKTWSAGFDWKPGFAPGASVSLSYFDIDYTDRIDRPIGRSRPVVR